MDETVEKMAEEILQMLLCEKSDGSGETASIQEINDNLTKISIFSH